MNRPRAKLAKKQPDSLAAIGRELRSHALILAAFVAILWAEEIVDSMLGGRLDQFGIVPRTIAGLPGILAAPFLHGGFPHLIANTSALVVLGWFVLLRERWHFFAVSAFVIVLGGFGTWLLGANAIHIGASGLIFGWLGYLLFGGFFERRVSTILGSLAVALLYGGMVFGVLPSTPGVSWEMHLFGFLAGALAAWVLARPAKRPA